MFYIEKKYWHESKENEVRLSDKKKYIYSENISAGVNCSKSEREHTFHREKQLARSEK